MIFQTARKLSVGLLVVIPLGLIASVMHAQASETIAPQQTEACGMCHSIVMDSWADSPHGHAADDQAFLDAWDGEDNSCMTCHTTGFDAAAGESEYSNVYCSTCHEPVVENHPDVMMPTDVSSRNCGECHVETFQDWEESVHSDVTLNCSNCHNPHTTTLKADSADALCLSCHEADEHSFSVESHLAADISCVDCHLRIDPDAPVGEGHSKRGHTFVVAVDSCTNCHEDDLGGGLIVPSDGGDASGPQFPIDDSSIANVPNPVGPLAFSLIAVIVGLAGGVLLAPWVETWYRKLSSS